MTLEGIRMVADWLEHATYGVNAKIDALDLDGSDTAPPDIVNVLDPTRDDAAAQDNVGADYPVLLVTSDVPSEWEGEVAQVHRDSGAVAISIRYITRDVDTAEATRNTLYTLRAIVMSLRALNDNSQADAARTRNGVKFMICTGIVFGEVREQIEGSDMRVTGAVVATYRVRDTSP